MLRKVAIHRFRSCRDLTIEDIGPSLVLVGRNGVGKTNVLRAIDWAAASARSLNPRLILPPTGENYAVEFEFDSNGTSYRYKIEADEPGSFVNESLEIIDEFGDWKSIASRPRRAADPPNQDSPRTSRQIQVWTATEIPMLMAALSFPSINQESREHFANVRDFLSNIHYYSFDEVNSPRFQSPLIDLGAYQEWLGQGEGGDLPEDSVLMALLRMSLERPSEFAEVKFALGSDGGLGLIDAINVIPLSPPPDLNDSAPEELSTHYALWFRPGREAGQPSRSFPYSALSLGTRRVIRMVVSMVSDRRSVILIEHPEDGLHRMMAEKLFSTLQSYTDPSQIIVTTHSTTIFNMLAPEEARIISMEDGVTHARAFSDEEAEAARRYMNEEGAFSDFVELHEGV